MVCFFSVGQSYLTARRGIFTRKQYRVGNFFHSQVTNRAQWTSAGRTTCELGTTVATNKVAALALQYRWQYIVETHRTLKETSQVIVGSSGTSQRRHPLGWCALGSTCRKCCCCLTAHFCAGSGRRGGLADTPDGPRGRPCHTPGEEKGLRGAGRE